MLQLQREASPEASRVHLSPGEAAKLGGELLRGPLCHPDTGPAQNGNCRTLREEMIRVIYLSYWITVAFVDPLYYRIYSFILLSILHFIIYLCSFVADR